jgi:FixJ family two-component response regulator
VVFVDDDADLRELFIELASSLDGRECLCAASLEELTRWRDRVLAAELVILDINLGAGVPSGLDAYRWLRGEGFRGRVAFLTGHAASHPLVAEARRIDGVRVLEKPLQVAAITELITQGPR